MFATCLACFSPRQSYALTLRPLVIPTCVQDSEGGGVEAEVDAEKLLWYLIEDLLSDDAEATGALHEPLVLSHGDCAYMASELGLMMTLCIQESQSAAAAGCVSFSASCALAFSS